MSTSNTKVPWAKSSAKQLLEKDIRQGVVTVDSDPIEVYYQMHNQVYLQYDFNKFKNYLKTLLKSHSSKQQQASLDSEALSNDLKIYPRCDASSRAYPRWDGSTAQRLLQEDANISSGMNMALSPMELRDSQEAYKQFPLKVFRDHIHQEQRRRNYSKYWASKKKPAAQK